MKKIVLHAFILSILLTMSAHAVLGGLGFHYAPNLTGGIEGSSNTTLQFEQGESYGMQGIGTKLWIDILPIVDVEATLNMQWNTYDVTVAGQDLEAETGLPGFDKAKPMFALVMADFSITYPFLSIPKIIKFYAGAGYSQIWSPKVINKAFFEETSTEAGLSTAGIAAGSESQYIDESAKQLKEESFNSGAGGHVILGTRTQLPLIPFDFYLNGKYHFGGGIDDSGTHGVTVELGGGFSI